MIRGQQIEISTETASNKEILKLIQPYHDSLQQRINEPLCYSTHTMSREESPLESSLGNFYADTCMEAADSIYFSETGQHTDFALFNYDGIRTSLPKGEIKVDHVFKIMPFENKLVVVTVSAEKIDELFTFLATKNLAHPVSGLKLVLDGNRFSTIEVQGKPLDPDRTYRVVTHDYLQKGGDDMSFFKNPQEFFNTNYKVRDALIDSLRKLDTIRGATDNRFINSGHL